ncbi:MAG: cation:proton antiporter, partial [Candidatus Heimdallarchaeota archaeon]
MITKTEVALAGFAILLLAGLFSDKLSKRNARFPRLIALIVGGIILGQIAKASPLSTVIGAISDPSLVLFIAEFALTLVLFKEGLELNLTAFRKSLRSVLILAFGAVILSSFIFAFVITLFTPINFFIALLIAGILAPTDPAATFSMFKGGLRLKPKEKNIIGSESALNDAVAIVLVTELFLSAAETGTIDISLVVLFAVFTGFFGGILLGYIMGLIFLKINQHLDHYVQTNYLSLALVGLTFVIPVFLHEYGITISPAITSLTAGTVFGNPQFFKFPRFAKSHIHEFNNGIAEIGEIVAFGAFGTLFSFVDFWLALGIALLFTIVTLGSRYIVVVYILRFPSGLTKNESIFIAWGGMRGLATGVLAIIAYQTFLLHNNAVSNIRPEVFLTSILIGLIIMTIVQGSTLKIVGMKTKSINVSNRKTDLLIERKIIISKLAFYQKERDIQELTMNEYKELTIPLRDRLTQIFHELQLEIVSRRERMRSYLKELELITTVIVDLGIDQDNVTLHEMHQEIKDNEDEIVEKIQTQLELYKLELASPRTRSVDKKNILEVLSETKDQLEGLMKKCSSFGVQ